MMQHRILIDSDLDSNARTLMGCMVVANSSSVVEVASTTRDGRPEFIPDGWRVHSSKPPLVWFVRTPILLDLTMILWWSEDTVVVVRRHCRAIIVTMR